MRPDETELNAAMDSYARGDKAAFAALHRALVPRLRAYFTRMCGPTRGVLSHRPVEDLIQETFLRIHRARGLFAEGSPALPWVYAIARNVMIDQARVMKLRPAPAALPEDGPDPADQSVDVESSAVAAQMARTVQRVLLGLPENQREAFVLLRYEGLSVQEAANVLGTTAAAVKLRAFRAYEALRQELSGPVSPKGDSTNPQGSAKPMKESAVDVKTSSMRERQR